MKEDTLCATDEGAAGARDALREIDLYASVWRLTDVEIEAVMLLPAHSVQSLRRGERGAWTDALRPRLTGLRELHAYLWALQPGGSCSAFWRASCAEGGPFRGTSPIEAVLLHGAAGVQLVRQFLEDQLVATCGFVMLEEAQLA